MLREALSKMASRAEKLPRFKPKLRWNKQISVERCLKVEAEILELPIHRLGNYSALPRGRPQQSAGQLAGIMDSIQPLGLMDNKREFARFERGNVVPNQVQPFLAPFRNGKRDGGESLKAMELTTPTELQLRVLFFGGSTIRWRINCIPLSFQEEITAGSH
jgi:hypothetical protein